MIGSAVTASGSTPTEWPLAKVSAQPLGIAHDVIIREYIAWLHEDAGADALLRKLAIQILIEVELSLAERVALFRLAEVHDIDNMRGRLAHDFAKAERGEMDTLIEQIELFFCMFGFGFKLSPAAQIARLGFGLGFREPPVIDEKRRSINDEDDHRHEKRRRQHPAPKALSRPGEHGSGLGGFRGRRRDRRRCGRAHTDGIVGRRRSLG